MASLLAKTPAYAKLSLYLANSCLEIPLLIGHACTDFVAAIAKPLCWSQSEPLHSSSYFTLKPYQFNSSSNFTLKLISCSTELSTKFILLINVKMATIVGIVTFISMINTTSERLKSRNFFICLELLVL